MMGLAHGFVGPHHVRRTGAAMSGFFDWFSNLIGSGNEQARPAPRTEAGRYTVVLENVGPDRRGVVDALLVITPLDLEQLDTALDSPPFTVRIGLTQTAAKSIQQRLTTLGAKVQINEFGD